MNTNDSAIAELVNAAKSRFLKDDGIVSVAWDSFVPAPKDGALPNLLKVWHVIRCMAEAMHIVGETELSRKVLQDWLHYVVGQSTTYYRNSSATCGAWVTYKRQYGYSPCCCCDDQSRLSFAAATLGHTGLASYAVAVQCPASPSGYRREVERGESLESVMERKPAIESCLRALVEGKIDFLSN